MALHGAECIWFPKTRSFESSISRTCNYPLPSESAKSFKAAQCVQQFEQRVSRSWNSKWAGFRRTLWLPSPRPEPSSPSRPQRPDGGLPASLQIGGSKGRRFLSLLAVLAIAMYRGLVGHQDVYPGGVEIRLNVPAKVELNSTEPTGQTSALNPYLYGCLIPREVTISRHEEALAAIF